MWLVEGRDWIKFCFSFSSYSRIVRALLSELCPFQWRSANRNSIETHPQNLKTLLGAFSIPRSFLFINHRLIPSMYCLLCFTTVSWILPPYLIRCLCSYLSFFQISWNRFGSFATSATQDHISQSLCRLFERLLFVHSETALASRSIRFIGFLHFDSSEVCVTKGR